MRMTVCTISRFAGIIAAVSAVAIAASCGKDPGNPDNPVTPKPVVVLTSEEQDSYVCELMARSIVLCILPDSPIAEVERVWEMIETIAGQPETKDFLEPPGVPERIRTLFDFDAAVEKTNAAHRATLLGVMYRCGLLGPAFRDQIYETLVKHSDIPDYCKVGSATFWSKFVKGDLDVAAVDIYHAVLSEYLLPAETPAQKVAEYMYDHNLRAIDMMRWCAASLVESGANIAFAIDGDQFTAGKPSASFIAGHGEALLKALEDNLASEVCVDAVNANLDLITSGLEKVIPTTQSLTEAFPDYSAAQIKLLGEELGQAVSAARNIQISDYALEWFALRAKNILDKVWLVDFRERTYEHSEDKTEIIFRWDTGDAYTFSYTKESKLILSGKCAISSKYISLAISYFMPDANDLLPRGIGITTEDIINIPYSTIDDGWGRTEMVNLWSDNKYQRSKLFALQVNHARITASDYFVDFGKGGGQKVVAVDENSYWYSGACAYGECEEWITISNTDNGFNIIAAENTTGLPRGGEIVIWATDIKAAAEAMQESPDLSYMEGLQSEYVIVTVTQAGR